MAITGATARLPAGRFILTYENANRYTESSEELTVSSSDSVFGFLEGSADNTMIDEYQDGDMFDEEEDQEEKNSSNRLEESKKFWQKQHKHLMATLCRTTALETGVRNVTKETMKEIQGKGWFCKCGVAGSVNKCRMCLMKDVSRRLRDGGHNSAICRSEWRTASDIPSGEHTFLDVIDNSSSKQGEVRVIIELNFRAEFEMARASDDYTQLINQLPEVYVGKVERLRALIKILCSASKKCMKDKKMHIGPWRKQKYIQAKWFSPCRRLEDNTLMDCTCSKQTSMPTRVSRITMALLDMPRKAITIV